MLYNYLTLAFRTIARNKVYSALNVGGIALGTAAFFLIVQYISLETSFNRFQKDLETTYRMVYTNTEGQYWTEMEPGFGPLVQDKFSSILSYCRFENGIGQGVVKSQSDRVFRESAIGYADGNFFNFFSFPIINGEAKNLQEPFVVFLSTQAAEKYFPNKHAMGEKLTLSNQFGERQFTVGGVFDMPANSDIRYDMVFSLSCLQSKAYLNGNSWAALENLNSQFIQTMVKLRKGTDIPQLEKEVNALRATYITEQDGTEWRLQPFSSVHLAPTFNYPYPTYANVKYIYILGTIAILILFMAWFNYVNLSTSQSLKRAGSVGIRRIVGASRWSLIALHITESMVINIIGFAMAALLLVLLQPLFVQLLGGGLRFSLAQMSTVFWAGLLILFLGAFFSGLYAAVIITNLNPIAAIKSKVFSSKKGSRLRQTLVVTQFAISIGLILCTAVIYRQLHYMQHSDLGMNIEKMLIVRGPSFSSDSSFQQRSESFLNALEALPDVQQFSQSGSIPGSYYNFRTAGFSQPGSAKGVEQKSFAFSIIDQRFLSTYDISLVAGRNFTAAETAVEWNQNDKVMMNERAIRELGFQSADQALNTRVQWDERSLQIVGIVKDYHHNGLQLSIDPIIFYPQQNNVFYSIRLSAGSALAQVEKIEKLYAQYFPNNPIDYFFADDNFNKQYQKEQMYSTLFTAAAALAICIACLGLFGLTTFTIQARKKEIGIRKILGASVAQITQLLSADFLLLVFIAGVVACPVCIWIMDKWLDNFAYKIGFPWWLLAIAVAAAMLIALITISTQTIKTALNNPVDALKSE